MNIILQNVGFSFSENKFLSNISINLSIGQSYAIIGPNGSGKSTLLKLIAGYLTPSEGVIEYIVNGKLINGNDIFKYIAIAAPYIELIEDFTIKEMIKFHFKFKKIINNYSIDFIINKANLTKYLYTFISNCSSGIKQKLRLTLALFSDVPVLLLDEPLTNLDNTTTEWYLSEFNLKIFRQNKLLVICSNNNNNEYFFCDEIITLKPK